VPYFKTDKWWKSGMSRALMEHEMYELGLYYVNGFKSARKESGREEPREEGRLSLRNLRISRISRQGWV